MLNRFYLFGKAFLVKPYIIDLGGAVENINGSGVRNISKKKPIGSKEEGTCSQNKGSHENIQGLSHLLPSKLPHIFISWACTKTKIQMHNFLQYQP